MARLVPVVDGSCLHVHPLPTIWTPSGSRLTERVQSLTTHFFLLCIKPSGIPLDESGWILLIIGSFSHCNLHYSLLPLTSDSFLDHLSISASYSPSTTQHHSLKQ